MYNKNVNGFSSSSKSHRLTGCVNKRYELSVSPSNTFHKQEHQKLTVRGWRSAGQVSESCKCGSASFISAKVDIRPKLVREMKRAIT